VRDIFLHAELEFLLLHTHVVQIREQANIRVNMVPPDSGDIHRVDTVRFTHYIIEE